MMIITTVTRFIIVGVRNCGQSTNRKSSLSSTSKSAAASFRSTLCIALHCAMHCNALCIAMQLNTALQLKQVHCNASHHCYCTMHHCTAVELNQHCALQCSAHQHCITAQRSALQCTMHHCYCTLHHCTAVELNQHCALLCNTDIIIALHYQVWMVKCVHS